MSESPSNPPPVGSVPPKPGGTSIARILVIAVGLAGVAGAAFGVVYYQNKDVPPVDTMKALKSAVTEVDRYSKLDPAYTDANGDLIADEPKDAAKFVNPAELTFTTVVFDDADKAEQIWKPFLDHLAQTTGKKVTYLKRVPGAPPASAPAPAPKKEEGEDSPPPGDPYALNAINEQLAAVREGKLHVTAFSTGSVTQAVSTAGFVPLFVPADVTGTFAYEMEIIVPAASPVQKPEDLKGKAIAFTGMSSNSGAKAPLVTLKEEFNLLPDRDYSFVFSGDHRHSIRDVAAGKVAAACVANDILGQMIAAGEVKADAFRSIYKSKPFPPVCFGVPVTLEPGLKASIRKAFETFNMAGTSVGERYKAQKRVKFVPVDYKKDFGYVREVDAKLSKFFEAK
ncbi:phosphate/phosphite/phosphonate ABC transporter substrate-binding protein [Limnoglobus roseus]|uniref:Phosphate/phosphite/phosphonate ABC transporter substrate-binding protein n=1 Tax=Limnoglobus roseus TaxID=2598579 RepID=A0A5C1AAB1_9BACT|nr:phosphate/phosphite/phosphonate ABC transporter substrate-binding protein [Limnoglobus roseus]QEL14966.1 phosphate/phosphite/phosphonate ABC transporter substrate-binding protein [Limnoglobus roseus]